MFLGFLGWAHQRTRIFRQRLLTRDPELFFRASVVGCARELVGALLVDGCFGLLPEPAEFFGDLATPLTAAGILQLAHDLLRLICVPIRVLTGLEHTKLIKHRTTSSMSFSALAGLKFVGLGGSVATTGALGV